MAGTSCEISISVIVPAYNAADTLGACLSALTASEVDEIEVIVVDDGSTDDTRAIAQGWAARDFRCSVLALKRNVGSAEARNRGARVARAPILFFTDADVRVPPGVLPAVLQRFKEPSVDGVVGLLSKECPYGNLASQFKNLWMHYTYIRQPEQVGLFFTSAAAIRSEVFRAEGGFDSHYRGASITEDIEFGQRLLGAGRRLVMEKRAAVVHQKHYSVGEVLRTDLLRARGLTLTFLRNHLLGARGEMTQERPSRHYASVPWFFGVGVAMMGLATLAALAAAFSGSSWLWLVAALAVSDALMFNLPFLVALTRWRGVGFGVASAGLLLADLYASGLGIALGFVDLMRGRRY